MNNLYLENIDFFYIQQILIYKGVASIFG